MKVAVLLSTYNGEPFIREQINSILNQQGNFELDLWIRDDHSTDQTRAILSEYEMAGKLNWYTGENLGAAHSFIDLIKHCKGYDFYAFSDQDDFWMPEKLQSGIDQIRAIDTAALCTGNAELVDRDLSSLGRAVYKAKPRTDFYTIVCAGGLLGCTMVFNHHLAQIVQKYAAPPRLVMHDFYLSVLCAAVDGAIIYDPVPYMKYRQHGKNVYGVPHGLVKTLLSRLDSVRIKSAVSIADQAESLLAIKEVSAEKRKWLKVVSDYRTSFFRRIKLATASRVSYTNMNQAITTRTAIFFANR